MFIPNLKEHLGYVGLHELHDKISAFRRLPINRLSREELCKEISDVLCFETPNGQCAVLTPAGGSYPAGTRFFRVRSLEPDDTKFPLRDMRIESDAWNPPTHVVRQGRLNREGESLLYTSPINPKTAVEEMKIPDDTNFSLIVYEALADIKVASIGITPDHPDLDRDEMLKLRMLNDFLAHEFTRDVGIGTEFLYRTSEIIAKNYYDLPPAMQDAWCYPSIADKPSVNVCFRPKVAHQKLRLLGVQIGTCKRERGDMLFNIKCIASGFNNSGLFIYHRIGSDVQRDVFPEIQVQEPNQGMQPTPERRG